MGKTTIAHNLCQEQWLPLVLPDHRSKKLAAGLDSPCARDMSPCQAINVIKSAFLCFATPTLQNHCTIDLSPPFLALTDVQFPKLCHAKESQIAALQLLPPTNKLLFLVSTSVQSMQKLIQKADIK